MFLSLHLVSTHVTQHCAHVSCLKKNGHACAHITGHLLYPSFVPFFFRVTTVLHSDDGQMESPLEALLGSLWRQHQESLHGSMGTRGPCLRVLWSGIGVTMENNQDLSDEEIFARFTHGSSDESESNCGSCWAPKPVNSSGIPCDTFKHTDDGWRFSRETPPVPQMQYERSVRQYELTIAIWPPTRVGSRRRAKKMVGCVWVLKTARFRRPMADPYARTLHRPLQHAGSQEKGLKLLVKFASTSSTSARDWSIAYPVKTSIVDQSRGRGTHRTTTAKREGRIFST